VLSGCSAEKTNVISRTYHNTTARYNAYYYAKEGIKTIEKGINTAYQNDYDHILKVFAPLDSLHATTYKAEIDDVLKKASISIQNHKNSKWVDDSYNLIGLARLYGHEHESAIETFKYVNTNSEDDNARHKALIYLMRTFIEYREMNNALAVSDYLKKEKLSKLNLKKLYLTRAYYYQIREDFDNMVLNLVTAAPLLSKKEGKAKTYFIIGQLYQKLGFDAEAYSNYRKCLANNPPYELSFYTKLNMAQVTEFSKNSDVKRIRKYFKKLVTDAKNQEFQDKIYYEMAQFEMKQENLEEALNYYRISIASSIGNNRQKGQSYLRLGEVYYDTLKNYQTAQAYYDSAIMVLPQDFENYQSIKDRQEILADFVKQLNTIQLKDSLLQLSEMDSLSLISYLEKVIADNQEEELKRRKKSKKGKINSKNSDQFNPNNTGIITSSLNWYFNNPSAIGLGMNEFRRKWGNRSLENDWRRSNKETITVSQQFISNDVSANSKEVQQISNETNSKETQLKNLLSQIPFHKEDKQMALKEIEDAYYNLGNIYHFNLEENNNAIFTFEKLINRFTESNYEPEVLYLLYLMLTEINDQKSRIYKEKLIAKHPKTTYAKLLVNPNYTEESSKELDQLKYQFKEDVIIPVLFGLN